MCDQESLCEPHSRLGIHSPPSPIGQDLSPSLPQAGPHPSCFQQAAPPPPPGRASPASPIPPPPQPPTVPPTASPTPASAVCPRPPESQLSSGWKSITRSCSSAACHTASLTDPGRGLHGILHSSLAGQHGPILGASDGSRLRAQKRAGSR